MNTLLSHSPFILVLCLAFVDIFYADGIPNHNTRNQWGSRTVQINSSTTTTTPWPTLKSRRDYINPSISVASRDNNNKQQVTSSKTIDPNSLNSNKRQQTSNGQQFKQGTTTTTPWPTLKSRRDYVNPSISVASRGSNNKQQSTNNKAIDPNSLNSNTRQQTSNRQQSIQGTTTTTPWPTLKSRREYVNPSVPKPMGAWSSSTNKKLLNTNNKATDQNVSNLYKNQQPAIRQSSMPNLPNSKPQSPNPNKNPASQTETIQNAVGDTSSTSSTSDSNEQEDNELREFSEALLKKDVNNAAQYITINLQTKTTSRSAVDEAPEPLLSLQPEVFKISTISKLTELYDNYFLDSTVNEYVTAKEKREEGNLLDAMLATSIMQYTRTFLIEKGKVSKDPKDFRDLLKQIWFSMYSRGGGRIGSSGFEHVFLAEIKNNGVSGLHNWIYFNAEELKNNANYLGYMKKIDLQNKGAIIKYHFKFSEIDKPVGSMFVGTSPELEIALYTTCFILRADKVCPVKLGGNNFIIRTYTYRYRGKNLIGSAFPEI